MLQLLVLYEIVYSVLGIRIHLCVHLKKKKPSRQMCRPQSGASGRMECGSQMNSGRREISLGENGMEWRNVAEFRC